MTFRSERVKEIISGIGHSKVLIIGDVMVDEYLHGKVDRISPEAPVPVVEISKTRMLLGGAANVAANIRALGDEPLLLGVVGDDETSERLRSLLAEKKISSSYLITDTSRPTTMKTRIIAHDQQVVRADREKRHDLDADIEKKLLDLFLSLIDNCQAVIISDYGKGMITETALEQIIDNCCKRNIFLAVDPKETRFHHYKKVSLITPNHHEAGFAFGRRILNEDDLYAVGTGLQAKLECEAILITRGPEGMSLFRKGKEPTHIPTFARQVYDVTGAGDTVIASYVSAISAGADGVEAAIVANAGAGWSVGEIGTATITREQLQLELMRSINDGILFSK